MNNLINFFLQIGKLKQIKRTGWVRKNIPNPESVAEHSFRTGVMAAIFSEQLGLDQLKSIKMALFHDVGDIVTHNGKQNLPNLEEKIRQEREGFKKVFSMINKEKMVSLCDEFEEQKTLEAKLVKDLDKLEMAIQAYEYETEYHIDLETFFESSRALIASDEIKSILQEIEKLRKKK